MILRFEEDFPGATIFKLEENYRSTQRILDAANALVANNQTRAPKKLFTPRGEGEPITRLPGGDRARRSALRRREGQESGARRRRLSRLPRAVPHERAVARLRRGAARRGHSLSRRRRRRLLRAHRNQRHHRVPALHRQPVRRARVQTHRERAAPRHRPADAGGAGAGGQRRPASRSARRSSTASCCARRFRRSSRSSSVSPS